MGVFVRDYRSVQAGVFGGNSGRVLGVFRYVERVSQINHTVGRNVLAVPVLLLALLLVTAACNDSNVLPSTTQTSRPSSTSAPRSTTSSASTSTVAATTTTSTSATLDGARWFHRGVGMSSATLASSGDIVLADDVRVYVADGFGIGPHPEYRVSAFDAVTGQLVWQRDDLTTTDSVDDVFLQALVGNTLVVNGQYDSVTAVESSSADTIWSFELQEGYGAVRSVVVDDSLVVGTEAPREGDVRPPIVYALDLADGSLLWETALAEGTDLQWSSPPVTGDLLFVSSTLSHPKSASGNMIHALNVSSGEVRWIADLGGDQGFHFYPALISGDLLVSMSPDGSAVARPIDDGSEAWVRPDAIPMAVDPDGTIYAYAQGVVELDPVDGSVTPIVGADALAMSVEGIVIYDDQLIVTGRSGAIGIQLPDGQEAWRINAPEGVAPAAVSSNLLVIAIDTGVAVFDLPE